MNNVLDRSGRKFEFVETLPNNERVNKMRLEQKLRDEAALLEEKQRRLKEEQKNRDEEEILRQMQNLAQMKQDDDDEIKEEQINATIEVVKIVENNLNLVIRALIDNVSPYELNFAGIDLDIIYFTTMMNILKTRGKSLHTLNLSRKGLTDKHASYIASMLKANKTLRRLELEGKK